MKLLVPVFSGKRLTLLIAGSILLLIAAVALVLLLTASAPADYSLLAGTQPEEPVYTGDTVRLEETGETLVGQQGGLALYYGQDTSVFTVREEGTDRYWSTSPLTEDYYQPERSTPVMRRALNSLCQLGYVAGGADGTLNNLDTEHTLEVRTLENGLALTFFFGGESIQPDNSALHEGGLGFTLEVWLKDGGLQVRIPRSGLVEQGAYKLVSITVMSMLGAADDSTDGFILLPDGSGSLFEFTPPEGRRNPQSVSVYSPRSLDLDEAALAQAQQQHDLILPTYGISRGSTAVLAYITQGDTTSYVTVKPSGNIYTGLNRVASTVVYRKTYVVTTPGDLQITNMEADLSAGDYAVRYFLIGGKDGPVTYSDMANTLRGYLRETERLTAVQTMPRINLHFLMGVRTETMLSSHFQTMTSFNQAQEILQQLPETALSGLRVSLLGWETSGMGVYPSGDKAAGALGGTGGLRRLSGWLKENGAEGYLLTDPILAQKGEVGFDASSQAVYNEMKLPITDIEGVSYLRNPLIQLKNLIDKRLPYLTGSGMTGVGFDSIGRMMFDDYQMGRTLTRDQYAQATQAMLAACGTDGLKAAAQYGNAYLLGGVDYLYDIPMTSSGYAITTRDIPFYQMVVHGSVAYSGAVAGNMSPDYATERLKWIEYGCEPYFLLTYGASEKLRNSSVPEAMATDYAGWLDRVAAAEAEGRGPLAFTASTEMVGHTVLDSGVVRLDYSGGRTIWINYNDTATETAGGTVPPMEYIVTGGAE